MSALSDLVYGKGQRPWPFFTDKFPVKVKQVEGLDNNQLKKDIEESGDYLGGSWCRAGSDHLRGQHLRQGPHGFGSDASP